ncbi:MAG: GLPGLI family protein, partial [Prevotellaceae bacterium]|nr:GLPGLI family protein [Prevotellaceae bacterium]
PKQDWKITNETKEISGYKCQKATCSFRGRDYVAWFTREIPVKEGPWKFDGLPGLIVKVYDTKEHYDFELYAVQKAGKAIIFNTDGYIKVNMKNYIQMSKNRIKNPFTGQNITFNVNGYPNSPRQRHYDIMERDIK